MEEKEKYDMAMKHLEHTNQINKRVCNVAIAAIVACVIITISHCVSDYEKTRLYFTTDYSYPSVNQSNGQDQNVEVNK